MDEQPPSSEPQMPPPMPVIPLAYQAKRSRRISPEEILFAVLRRVVLAVGAGLLVAGITGGIFKGHSDSPAYAGIGAFLIVMVLPLGQWWRRWQVFEPDRDERREN